MTDEHLKTVYGFIIAYRKRHGWSPTFAEIARGCILKHYAVKKAVLQLQDAGKLRWTPRRLRSIVVTNGSIGGQV